MVNVSEETLGPRREKGILSTRATTEMDLKYLRYLAQWGSVNLHAGGTHGTGALIERMELRAGHRVLDLGCGTGASMVRVADVADIRVDGLDVLQEMIDCARLRIRLCGIGRRCRAFLASPGSVLPLPESSYDRIYTEGVIGFQTAAGVSFLLGEIHRLLKPGGLYAANETIWKTSTAPEVAAFVFRTSLEDFGLCQAGEELWDRDRWIQVMEAAGFDVVSSEDVSTVHLHGRSKRLLKTSCRQGLSRAVTFGYGLRAIGRPQLLGKWLQYRKRLQRHRSDRRLVESRLFLLRKPTQTPT